MEVFEATVSAGQALAVVREELESSSRGDGQVVALGALEARQAAGNGGKDVVRVHGPEDQVRTVPLRVA